MERAERLSRKEPNVTWDEEDESAAFKVVVNHEEQYSIWPAEGESPLGWTEVGVSGTRAECLAHINEVWTDMRPLSLRTQMTGADSRAKPR
jgi:MbtH protein